MNKKHILAKDITIRWVGIFDLDDLYKKTKYWLDYQGFGNENFEEREYSESMKGEAKEIHWTWYSEKRESDYFSYVIETRALLVGMKPIEITKEGGKLTLAKGDIKIWVTGYLLSDCNNKFKNILIQTLYEKFLIHTRIEKHKSEIYDKIYSFQDEVKRYLDLKQP